jgi:RNA polymerase sigma factor
MAMGAAEDELKLERFISENEQFIVRCTSLIVHRYITKSDDEWSIALIAFTEAVQDYHFDKGSFLSFAKTVIRRRLIDFQRSKSKYNSEIPVNPAMFGTDEEDEAAEKFAVYKAVTELSVQEDHSIRYEIEAIDKIFRQYGFSFMDLAECSPKSEKTKLICAKAVIYVLRNPLLIREMRVRKMLPLKTIASNVEVPRKKLECHRKYIIAAVEILSGEYPCLAGYMHYIKEEIRK